MTEPFLRNLSTILFIITRNTWIRWESPGIAFSLNARLFSVNGIFEFYCSLIYNVLKGTERVKYVDFAPLMELCISIGCFQLSGL